MLEEKFTPQEELANAASAGVGTLMSIAALTVMAISVSGQGALHMISAVVFGASLVALYGASTLNHALPAGRAKNFFHIVDLAAIYVLIAGTYTPFTLLALHNRTGYVLFGVIWGLALFGTVRKLLAPNDFETGVDKMSVISYVAMGWMLVVAPMQLIAGVPTGGLVWLFGGGVFYTGGVVFFRMRSVRFHHLIWHLCVIGGSTCHVISVHKYVLPLALP